MEGRACLAEWDRGLRMLADVRETLGELMRNRVIVMLEWAWSYFTYQRGARLITGSSSLPSLQVSQRNVAGSLTDVGSISVAKGRNNSAAD